jgi:pyruvate dehydrogenase E1 component alpha subunit
MHLIDQSVGFYGSVPIVAGTVPLAVGAALARRMQGTDSIGVAYLGDGAMEEGVVHESLNLAKVINAPTLFVVENNFYASHMHIHLRQPDDSVARFAMANRVPYKVVDGNDVIAVASAARELIQYSRSTGSPALIEAVTYRWLGHVDWRDDIDVGVDRSAETLAQWKARDPLARLAQSMLSQNICTQDDMVDLEREVTREIEVAWQKAKSGVDHDGSNLLRNVYA